MSELTIALGIANALIFLLGVFYAWQIYLAPSPHGWTWISVAVGVLILLVGTDFNYFILYHYQTLTVTTVLVTPVIPVILAGGPMVATQAYKKYKEDRDNKRLLSGDNESNLDR